jgi:hypothetical protein
MEEAMRLLGLVAVFLVVACSKLDTIDAPTVPHPTSTADDDQERASKS